MRMVCSGLVALASLASLASLLATGCPRSTPAQANAPPVPLAEKLCNALTTLPEKKRAACCNGRPSIVITAECTRQLSAAIRHDALALDENDVDACIAAFDKTLEGCDWVGPFPPGPPAECQGIFKGKRTAGQKCRSSLECARDLRCKDLGPTTVGKCGPAGAGEETSCGGTVDSLATYTRQNDVDQRHPECKERCIKHKCQPPIGEAGSCLISSDCQDGMQCLPVSGAPPQKNGMPPKKCVTGKVLAKDGEPCPGGVCEGSLQCIRGKCAARKATGEACTDDFECRGGCSRDAGTKGTCGPPLRHPLGRDQLQRFTFATTVQRESGPIFESNGLRERIGSALFTRAAAGAGSGATIAGAGSAGAAGTGAGARIDWLMSTAEAPSPTQKALHAVLINRSIVRLV